MHSMNGIAARRRKWAGRAFLILIFICGVLSPFLFGGSRQSVQEHRSESGAGVKLGSPSFKQVDDGTEDPLIAMRVDPFDGEERSNPPTEATHQRPPHSEASNSAVLTALRQQFVTVVVMSYPKSSRFHLLEDIIRKCSQWPFVWEILLVWNGDAALIPLRIKKFEGELRTKPLREGPASSSESYWESLVAERAGRGQGTGAMNRSFFRILPQSANRVDNRWRIAPFVDTDAILNMDDDINLYEVGGRCMFDVWRATPASLVAIDVRSHFLRERPNEHGKYGYVARDKSAGYKQYSIALPRALLTHRAYFEAYDTAWRRSAAGIGSGVKRVVDDLLCDDIAFNFIAANTSLPFNHQLAGATVVYAKAKYAAYPESHAADGMTKMDGMKAKRQKCVNVLADVVGSGHVVLRHRPWHVLCEVDG